MKSSALAILLDDNSDLSKIVAALLALYQQGSLEDRPFQDILKDFLEDEVIVLSEDKQDVLLARLVDAAAWLRETITSESDNSLVAYNLARMLDNMRYAIYRRLAARMPLPIRPGGADF
jgi:hypothetical protein